MLFSLGKGEIMYKNHKQEILEIVRNAGNLIAENFYNVGVCETKSYANYVTDLDKRVEEFVISSIQQIQPNAHFIAEESITNAEKDDFWILDPIDGTTNLIHGYTSVCVSLACVIKSEIVFGVVYCPITKELFYAEKDNGSYLESNGITKKLRVDSCERLQGSLIGFGCPYNKNKIDQLFRLLKSVLLICDDLKRQGPASLDLCYVACGRLSGYLELDLELWDYAAGALILQEAGGIVSNFENKTPVGKSSILATNGKIHKEILEKIKFCKQ